jgi:hypothetical protein
MHIIQLCDNAQKYIKVLQNNILAPKQLRQGLRYNNRILKRDCPKKQRTYHGIKKGLHKIQESKLRLLIGNLRNHILLNE